MKNNFNLVMSWRQKAVFCLEIMLSSKNYVQILDNTKEANVFNVIGFSLYSKALIEIRKILEPSTKKKKANLPTLITYIKNNKDNFINQHYESALKRYINEDISDNHEMSDMLEHINKQEAMEAKEKCQQQINLVVKMWDVFWNKLGTEYAFIRDNRDDLVHSFSITTTTFPSISKLYKVLNISTWFLKKIDFIMNNSSYGYKYEKEQLSNISKKFWSHVK